ncbi:MAG: acyl-CoA dehydrogenase, partial [Dietzia cercidiphylli]
IDSLYEGTTAIQAQDFFFRKIARDRGTAIGHVSAQIKKFLEADGPAELTAEREVLATALADVEAMVGTCFDHLLASQEDPKHLYTIGLASVRLLMAFGDLMMGWRLLVGAEVALGALDGASDADKGFYNGKIAAAKWFANNELPLITATRGIVAGLGSELMELDEAAF